MSEKLKTRDEAGIHPHQPVSISDDDKCHDCRHLERASCRDGCGRCALEWAGLFNHDLYIVECPEWQKKSEADRLLDEVRLGAEDLEGWVPGEDVDTDSVVESALHNFKALDLHLQRGGELPTAWRYAVQVISEVPKRVILPPRLIPSQEEKTASPMTEQDAAAALALLRLKRRVFAEAVDTTIPEGAFAGMKIRTLTTPLPRGCIGLMGNTPEDAIFVMSDGSSTLDVVLDQNGEVDVIRTVGRTGAGGV